MRPYSFAWPTGTTTNTPPGLPISISVTSRFDGWNQSLPLSSRIAYAAWLDQMELKDEARKYWQTAATERPDDPRLKALAEQ